MISISTVAKRKSHNNNRMVFTVIWNLLKIGILLVIEGPWVE